MYSCSPYIFQIRFCTKIVFCILYLEYILPETVKPKAACSFRKIGTKLYFCCRIQRCFLTKHYEQRLGFPLTYLESPV